MKSLYFISTTYFSDNDIGVLHLLTPYYDVHYVVVITVKNNNFSSKELEAYCKSNNIHFHPVYLKYRYRHPFLLLTFFNLVRFVIKQRPDIILFVNYGLVNLNIFSLLFPKSRTIIATHDVETHSSGARMQLLVEYFRNILMKKYRYLQAYSLNQSSLMGKLYKGKRIFTIPMPLKDFGSSGAIADPVSKEKVFLFFGNIKSYKGLDVLLLALNILGEKGVSCKVVVAGRCDDWETVYEPLIYFSNLLDKQVRFIDNKEVPYFFERAHYLVLPYKDATQSGPLMIAYHYSVPVICSDIPAFREFTEDGTTGFSFKNYDADDLAEQMVKAIDMPPDEYQELRERLRRYVQERYSSDHIRDLYLDMFNTVLNQE